MKALLVGNCQVVPLRKNLVSAVKDLSIDAYEVYKMTPERCSILSTKLDQYDLVISQPLRSDRYRGLTQRELIAASPETQKLIFIHNLHFQPIVPDCIYVGPLGQRISSPLSGYHSAVVLQSYLEGQSERQCLHLLESGESVNVKRSWKMGVEEFRAREADVDVTFWHEMFDMMKKMPVFHVVNHPAQALLDRYAEAISKYLGLSYNSEISAKLPDLLVDRGKWPIRPWVAETLGFDYSSSVYWLPSPNGLEEVSTLEFIERCYAIYAEQTPSVLSYA